MKRLVFILAVLFFSYISCIVQKQPTIKMEGAIEQSLSIAQNIFDKGSFPGMAVSVMLDGKMVWSKGFGFADIEAGIVVDPSAHMFRIGSVSKTLTSVALAQLYENGKLDINAEVQEYVPGFPKKEYPVRVNEVAHHVAGIRHYNGLEFMSNVKYSSVSEGLTIFKNDPLLFEPGMKYSYSTYGWNLLSAVVEGASGRNFLEYMQTDIFDKANMPHTVADHKDQLVTGRVQFYIQVDGDNQIAPEVDLSNKWAGGGFLGTSEDLLRFGDAVLKGELIENETLDRFCTPYVLKNGKSTTYGLGWRIGEDKKGRNWIGHSGGSMGGTTMFLVYPKDKLVVVTVVNLSGAKMDQLAWKVANQFLTELEK